MKTGLIRWMIRVALASAIPLGVIAGMLMESPAPAEADGTNWRRIRILKQSDAEMVDAGGTTKTITLDGLYAGGKPLEITDYYIDMVTAFNRSTDGGPATVVLDIGKSGATAKYANDIDLQATTDRIGSHSLVWTQILDGGTTQFLPPYLEAAGVAPVLTITSASGNINLNDTGEAHIYVKYGPLPKVN